MNCLQDRPQEQHAFLQRVSQGGGKGALNSGLVLMTTMRLFVNFCEIQSLLAMDAIVNGCIPPPLFTLRG